MICACTLLPVFSKRHQFISVFSAVLAEIFYYLPVTNQWRICEGTGTRTTENKMTERFRSDSCANAGYISAKMANGLSPRKTMLILVVVVGCFAVLWPKVFYPMLAGSAKQHIKPSAIDKTQGCCDVISETDINTIKIMSELCSTIIKRDADSPLTGRELIARCRSAVLETCDIDISAVLQEQVRLGQTTKQILDEIRSLNGSLCLKYNFGVAPWMLGVPHRVIVKASPSISLRQERPLQLRSEMVHPAFRERGRAIPQPQPAARPSSPSHVIKVVEGRPGPIPGMRPTMGGAGHVVPSSKQSTGSMGLIMPIYTIGIVVFFAYTVMKVVFKKQPEALYPPVEPDPIFRKEVFESESFSVGSKITRDGVSNKLVVNAMSALLDEVNQELASHHRASEVTEQDVMVNGNVVNQDDQASVKVLGMEMTASCEGGKKWNHPVSPVTPAPHPHPQESLDPPQEIFLEGSLPPQSHILVADAATEAQKLNSGGDPAVILAGKMTLSVISLDSSENGTEESSSFGKQNEDRSSNISEEFEKVEADLQLEEQIDNIIEEAHAVTEQCLLENEIDQNEVIKEFAECESAANIKQLEAIILPQNEVKVRVVDEITPQTSDETNVIEKSEQIMEDEVKQSFKKTDEVMTEQDTEQIDLISEETKSAEESFKQLPEQICEETKATEESFVEQEPEQGLILEEIKATEESESLLETDDNKIEEIQQHTYQILEEEKAKTEDAKAKAATDDGKIEEIRRQNDVLDIEDGINEAETDDTKIKEMQKQLIHEETNRETEITTVRSHGNSIEEVEVLTGLEEMDLKIKDAEKHLVGAEQNMKNAEDAVQSETETENFAQNSEVSDQNENDVIKSEENIILDKLNEAITDISDDLRPEDPNRRSNGKVPDFLPEHQEQDELLVEDEQESDDDNDGEDIEVEYEYEDSDNEEVEEELRNITRRGSDQGNVEQVNGNIQAQACHGITRSVEVVENDESDDGDMDNQDDDDEEVEEIIEYVTDEEEIEEVEPKERNNVNHVNGGINE